MKKAKLLAGVTALFMCGISFFPAMAQASSLLGLSSSTLPLSDVGEEAEGGDRVVNLTISWGGMTDICMGYLLRDSWMITAAHCFASGLPLENYAISGSAGKGAVEEIFFRKNVDIALVRLNGEFEVSGCAPLTPSPTRSGESVEAVLRGGKQVVPFVIQSENHIASNPSINVAAHPMLSLFPGEGGRLTKPGESGAPLLSEGADGHKYLKGVISGVSMQQGVSLAEDVYRYQGFVSSHVGECVLKG